MKIGKLISLITVNLLYAIVLILNRMASIYAPLSHGYILLLSVSLIVLAIYAFSWQQIIKRMPISDAYMFKGSSIVFVLLLSAWLFEEVITWQNVVGSIVIILGIALFAKADKEAKA